MNNIHSHNNHFLFILKKTKTKFKIEYTIVVLSKPHLDDTRHIVPSSPPFYYYPCFYTKLFIWFFSPILFKCIFDSEYMVRLPETPSLFSFSLFLSPLLCKDNVRFRVIFGAKTYFEELSPPFGSKPRKVLITRNHTNCIAFLSSSNNHLLHFILTKK